MEPARESGALVVARGMVGAVGLEVHGQTAHAAFGDRGASAVEELAHKILALRGLSDPAAGVLVNVGVVRGGSARQVVPDLATASVDLRAPSAATADRLMAGVERVARERRVPGTSCALSGGITRPAFERGAGTDALLGLAAEVGHEIGIAVEGAATRAGSDGNFTAALGVPTLDGLGPIGRNVCSRDEYVVLDSVPGRAALLAGLIARLPELPPRCAGGGSLGGRRSAGVGSPG